MALVLADVKPTMLDPQHHNWHKSSVTDYTIQFVVQYGWTWSGQMDTGPPTRRETGMGLGSLGSIPPLFLAWLVWWLRVPAISNLLLHLVVALHLWRVGYVIITPSNVTSRAWPK